MLDDEKSRAQPRHTKIELHPPLTVTIARAGELSGLGRSSIYELFGRGVLETVKVGRRRLIVYASLQRLLSPEGR